MRAIVSSYLNLIISVFPVLMWGLISYRICVPIPNETFGIFWAGTSDAFVSVRYLSLTALLWVFFVAGAISLQRTQSAFFRFAFAAFVMAIASVGCHFDARTPLPWSGAIGTACVILVVGALSAFCGYRLRSSE